MPTLKDRQRQIPNGFKFALPEVGYQSAPFASFDAIVNSVDNIVRANPGKAQAQKWPASRADIAAWVDDFNARWCLQNGWLDFINGAEDSPPKHGPPPGRPAALVAGARASAEFLLSGQPPVAAAIATQRAAVCAACPKNQPGDLGNFFERATAELLRTTLGQLNDLKLATPHDSKLGVCSACYCPMRLKVWYPIEIITRHLSPEVRAEFSLDQPRCWVLAESE